LLAVHWSRIDHVLNQAGDLAGKVPDSLGKPHKSEAAEQGCGEKALYPGSAARPEKSINESIGGWIPRRILQSAGEYWRPVRESNPCRRREREANHSNSMKLRGMDSTLPHLKD